MLVSHDEGLELRNNSNNLQYLREWDTDHADESQDDLLTDDLGRGIQATVVRDPIRLATNHPYATTRVWCLGARVPGLVLYCLTRARGF